MSFVARRLAAFSTAIILLTTTGSNSIAQKKYDTGATDTEIKIGNTMPYSGPLSTAATIGHTEAAYFQMLDKHGGVNGRKITFILLDDAYSPPKTVEQVRKLVEQEQVLAIFGIIGTPTAAAAQRYLNEHQVPELFIQSGAPASPIRSTIPGPCRLRQATWTRHEPMPDISWKQNLRARSVCSIRTTISAGPISTDSSKV